jgi:carboxyl-terminal processing protease
MWYKNLLLGVVVWIAGMYVYFLRVGTLPFVQIYSRDAIVTQQAILNGTDRWEQAHSMVEQYQELFQKFHALYELLSVAYYDQSRLDPQAMLESALKWFVNALDDPYTVYLTPEENRIFDEGMQWSQNFQGIGAVVTKRDDGIMVETVLKGSPAFHAWIMPLDMIVKIDEVMTDTLSLSEWVALIRWEKWTTVLLTIMRMQDGIASIQEIAVVRDTIDVPSVEWELITVDGQTIFHLTVSIFGDDTMRVFERVMREVDISQVDSIIIDLRWNWWGILPIAIDFASYFLPRNEVITTAKYSIFDDEIFRSKWHRWFQWMNIVVLVDWMSASASEIIAASLRERGNATIIWTTTFGKWSIQSLQEKPDGSSVKFTIWNRYTPSWKNINETWVRPTKTVELDRELRREQWEDTQLNAAIDYLLWNPIETDE